MIMQPSNCQHTNGIIQKLNHGSLEPADEQHIATCACCREAVAIRRLLLEAAPSSIPDRSALVWQQHTINKLLRREKQQSAWQVRLSMLLEMAGIALITGGILIVNRLDINWPAVFQFNIKIIQPDRLVSTPLQLGLLLVPVVAGYLSFRLRKHKKLHK